MWDLNYKHLHILFTMQVALFRVIWAVFAFLLFLDTFPFDLTLSITSISPQFDGVRLRLENFPQFNGLFLLRAVPGVPTLCFIGRRHDPVDSRFDEVRKAFKALGV